MGGTYCINFQHIVFRIRHTTIKQCHLAGLHAYMAGTLCNMKVKHIQVGGVGDHVHILGEFGKLHLPDVVKSCKIAANIWLRRQDVRYYHRFHWQPGYGSFSVSPCLVKEVKFYIQTQYQHHAMKTTKDEILDLMEEYNISI